MQTLQNHKAYGIRGESYVVYSLPFDYRMYNILPIAYLELSNDL
jgi:hypothetical protein